MRSLMMLIGGVVGALVLGVFALEKGEAVLLTTQDTEMRNYETTLWSAELDGALYLRASRPDAGWLRRLRARPEVILREGGESVRYRARVVDEPEIRRRLERAMASKYGAAHRFWSLLADPEQAVPVRLEPAAASR